MEEAGLCQSQPSLMESLTTKPGRGEPDPSGIWTRTKREHQRASVLGQRLEQCSSKCGLLDQHLQHQLENYQKYQLLGLTPDQQNPKLWEGVGAPRGACVFTSLPGDSDAQV